MEALTGLTELDWVLIGVYAVALTVVLGSPAWHVPGGRWAGILVVPFAVGVTAIVILFALNRHETAYILPRLDDRAATFVVSAAVGLIGAAIADFLVSRIAALLSRAVGRTRIPRQPDLVLAVALGLPVAVAVFGATWVDGRATSSYELSRSLASAGARIRAEFELPGQPVDLAMHTETEGYISFAEGRIGRIVLPEPGGRLSVTTVAGDLQSPRGIAVVGGSLVVAELGRLPCPDPVPPCKGEDVDAGSVQEGERRILRRSRGRLVRFAIGPHGGLSDRQVIARDLPVANSDHGVNAAIEAGGRVYVSIGHLDRLFAVSLTPAERTRPSFDLLGTVISLRPDGGDLEVVARGLRNVYDLAFDDAGRLYGVDNDGPTMGGWRREEVLEIRPGGHYGYPYDGTFSPYSHRTVPPLWILDTVGSAGIEWIGSRGRSRLVVGSCDDVYAVDLAVARGDAAVDDRQAVEHLLRVPGCVTAVERIAEERLAMTLFTFGGPPRLYLVDLKT